MSEQKTILDERVETVTQITTTLVAAHRVSPAQGAEIARKIIEESIRVAQEMSAADREIDPRAAGAAMVQRRAAQHQS